LTVLDNRVHVDLVRRGKGDLVSLSILVSTRLFKDDFDLGLFISFGHVRRGRRAYLGLSSTGKRGRGVHGGTVHQYLVILEHKKWRVSGGPIVVRRKKVAVSQKGGHRRKKEGESREGKRRKREGE
jgi:hypothetical protein